MAGALATNSQVPGPTSRCLWGTHAAKGAEPSPCQRRSLIREPGRRKKMFCEFILLFYTCHCRGCTATTHFQGNRLVRNLSRNFASFSLNKAAVR